MCIRDRDESAYLDDATYAWGSPEWVHDSKLIIEECQKLGMSVSMTGGTNWATANLINITPNQEEASQELGYATVEVAPGETFDGVLPKCVLPDGVTKQVFKEVVGIQAVSYTHLDVYKRQDLINASQIPLTMQI